LHDEAGVDGSAEGLGLLPVMTRYQRDKLTRRVSIRFDGLCEPWDTLNGVEFEGYEIRHGRLEPPLDVVARGSVLGLAAHGAFESDAILAALFGRAPQRSLDAAFDRLADSVEEHLDTNKILELAGVA
jgi:adenosylcobyric acid synthase